MNKFTNLFLKLFFSLAFSVVILYVLFLTVLPKILSSPSFLDAVDELISEKTGIVIESENINVRTYPDLTFIVSADKFNVNSNNQELLRVKNGSAVFDLLRFKIKKADIDYIYLNQKHIQNFANQQKNKNSSNLKFNKIPELNIKNVEIWIDKGKIHSIFINIDNIKVINENNKTICVFEAEIMSELLKNLIHIGRKGNLYIQDKKLIAENLEVLVGTDKLIVDGKITDSGNKTDFTVKGEDIPVADVMSFLLYIQKVNDKSRKFIENFYDFSGKLDINLQIKETGIYGNAIAEKLAGKTVLFNVPILFEKVPFKFNGQEFSGGAYGTLGGDKVYADFSLINMMSEKRESQGTVKAVLTNTSVKKYVPHASLKEKIDATVDWHIKNKNITVLYNLYIPQNSDIYYKNAYLGLNDKDRQLYVKTYKQGDNLAIKEYEYFIKTKNGKNNIIMGNGNFTKVNDVFEPDFITCRTENDAPVSVAGSFYKYLKGGVFNGNLKYDFHTNKITGNFNIKESEFKDYKIYEADVLATDKTVSVKAQGKYDNSSFSTSISALNNFNDKIHIYNLSLFLDEYKVKKSQEPSKSPETYEEIIKKQTDNFDIDLYTIKLNKLFYKRVVLKDILLKGSIKNNIFNFEVPHILFADGVLYSKGLYDFNSRTSDVVFSAKNINSNIAADVLFNLKNQIQGIANATLSVKTRNGINDKKGRVEFSIKEGYLPQFGNTEFVLKNSFKFKLKDVISIDMKDMKKLSSDIAGSFDINNNEIQNAHITSSQKFLALIVLGDYNIKNRYANVEIFGKYNKEEISKIKIFFIPLPFIVKFIFKPEYTYDKYKIILNEIPDVGTLKPENIRNFRIKIEGDMNKNDIKTEMKNIL